MADETEMAILRAGAEQPLERTWEIWHNGRQHAPHGRRGPTARAEATYTEPKVLGSFGTIRTLWEWMNNVPTPGNLKQDVNLYIFQKGIDPAWEHPDNCNGGRWTYTYDQNEPAVADRAWQDMYLVLVGETLAQSAEVTGISATRRQHYIRLAIWTRDRANEAAVMAIGLSLRQLVTTVRLEYQDHGGSVRHTLE